MNKRVWFYLFLVETVLVICGAVYAFFAAPEIFNIELDPDAIESTIVSIMTSGITTSMVSLIIYTIAAAKAKLNNDATTSLVSTSQSNSLLLNNALIELSNKLIEIANNSVATNQAAQLTAADVSQLTKIITDEKLAKKALAIDIINNLNGDENV